MPIIRPISDLRNKIPEIKEICIKEQQALLNLYDQLDEAEEQSRAGKTRRFREVMAEQRNRINAKA